MTDTQTIDRRQLNQSNESRPSVRLSVSVSVRLFHSASAAAGWWAAKMSRKSRIYKTMSCHK